MKSKLFIIFLIALFSLINFVNASFYYDVSMNYSNGNIKINSIDVIFSHYDLYSFENNSETYEVKIGDKTFYFNVPERYYDVLNENGEIVRGGKLDEKEFEFELFFPYSGSGKFFEVYDQGGEKIVEKSLIEYTRYYTQNEYEKINNIDEPKNSQQINETIIQENKKSLDLSIILIVILILILIILIIYYVTRDRYKKRR